MSTWGPWCVKCGHPSSYHTMTACGCESGGRTKLLCDCDGYSPRSDPNAMCEPCSRDDHDACTGDCISLCCALASCEAEIEWLNAE